MVTKTPVEAWIRNKILDSSAGAGPLTRAMLESYQLAKLRDTITLARQKSQFYRTVLQHFPADRINSLRDLQELPFTTATDLRQNPHGFLTCSQDEISRIVTLESSGTTGSPKRIFFTAADQELTMDYFHNALPGVAAPGDKVLILLPGERLGSAGGMFAESASRMGVKTVIHGFVGDPEATLRVMAREEINMLLGIPVQVLALANFEPPGENRYQIHIKNVILNADHMSQALVSRIQKKWNCRVFNHYAMSEMGMAGGIDCDAFTGLHLREADLLFEIVNPDTGEAVTDGEEGEVVFTTLTRQGMPLIRYRTGDFSRFIPAPCACGTVLKRLAPVKDRINGKISLPGGEVLSMSMLDEALFAVDGVLNFQAMITTVGHTDSLEIKVHVTEWADASTVAMIHQALLSIPVLADNVDKGLLTLAPVAVDAKRELWQPAKRIIKDLRSEERG